MGKLVIWSGGQSGADIAGLLAAKLHGLETGGWMPKGFRTLNGAKPEYAKLFGVREHENYGYKDRTWKNVEESDLTIRFAVNFESAGEKCTYNAIQYYKKPSWDFDVDSKDPIIEFQKVDSLANYLYNHNEIKIVNIAGNSQATWEGMQKYVTSFLSYVFMSLGYDRVQLGPEYKQFAQLGYL